MMMLLMMQPRSQVLSYPSRWWCFFQNAEKRMEQRTNQVDSERNPAFSFFRLAPSTGQGNYQARLPSKQNVQPNWIRVLDSCKVSQENMVVPLQNCIAVYNGSLAKHLQSELEVIHKKSDSSWNPLSHCMTLNSFSWFKPRYGRERCRVQVM